MLPRLIPDGTIIQRATASAFGPPDEVGVAAGEKDEEKATFLEQLEHLNANYNGGLKAYIRNAKQLLQDAQAGELSC